MTDARDRRQGRNGLGAGRRSAGLALRIERLWPLLAPFVLVVSLFLVLAWSGLFRAMPDALRIATVVALLVAALAALWPLARYRGPTPHEIDRRLESANALAHQPVSSQGDTLPPDADPVARALWDEHRRRMARGIGRLGGTSPRAGMPRRDPWALRALAPLTLVVAFAFSLGTQGGRIADAFAPPAREMSETVAARLDAWVTPPAYTGVAPIFLTREGVGAADGSRTVPAGSVFTARVAEAGDGERVELVTGGGARAVDPAEADGPATGSNLYEVALDADATLRVTIAGQAREFAFAVTPDEAPGIAWAENDAGEAHEVSDDGALTLRYRATDDYALASGTARFRPLGTAEAAPLYDAPEMALAMPRQAAEGEGAARTTRNLTEHPFAGAVTEATLEATDKAGQVARSEPRRIVLPERPFRNPLARMLIEQRRSLALDANQQWNVVDTLDLVLLHAETVVDNTPHYLGLVTAKGRVANAWDEDGLREAVDYLWELARGIEDGALTSAERRLRDAQDALAEALENDASDEELAALMEELREAMDEFMRMLAERAMEMPQTAMPMPQDFMTQDDIERMLDNMEEAARDGRREQAQAMLDELRRMMDQMQAGAPPQQGDQQMGEMQQQMQEMGDLLREQQELMDETFRMEGSRPPPGSPPPGDLPEPNGTPMPERFGQQPQQSPRQGARGGREQNGQEQAERQQGQQGQRPQAGEPMSPEEFAEAMEQLRQRQQELQQRLEEMQEAMEGMGLEPSEDFADAGEAMGDAEGDLGEGESGRAVDDQGRAIEALRQGAQNMMQQMMQAMQGQQPGQGQGMQPGMQFGGQQPQPGQQGNPFQRGFGQNRADRDPLGRPRATQGPQFGDEIEVPDEIDTQRARRILEAIRKRLGRQLTPKLEREYLERLLEMR